MASSWLDRVVADHLGEALAWRNTKRNVKTEPGTEPKQHHQYTDNGSSLKVRVSIPSAVLQVLKVSLCVRRRFFYTTSRLLTDLFSGPRPNSHPHRWCRLYSSKSVQ